VGIQKVNPLELPLYNTILLLSSGVTITYAHHCFIYKNRRGALNSTVATILLAVIFTISQVIEYSVSSFTISDSVFGSTFYFSTGFHGFHVIIGTIFLFVGLYRVLNYHLINQHHIGLESSILYWHFVDLI
jgi:cytochrome c oxidase subunit 3